MKQSIQKKTERLIQYRSLETRKWYNYSWCKEQQKPTLLQEFRYLNTSRQKELNSYRYRIIERITSVAERIIKP